MGYMHGGLLLSGQAVRKGLFEQYMREKIAAHSFKQPVSIALTIFEDSEIGGTLEDKIIWPDFSDKNYIFKQIEEQSMTCIDGPRSMLSAHPYPPEMKRAVRDIIEKTRADEMLYKLVCMEYESWLDYLEKKPILNG